GRTWLQPVIDGHPARPQAQPRRDEGGGGGQRERVGPAGARHQHQVTGGQVGQAGPHRAADLGDRDAGPHGYTPDTTRSTHWCGWANSSLTGRVSGDVQTLLKSAMPTSSTTALTNREPSAYCFIFRSMPSMRRMACSIRPCEPRRALNRSLICSTEGTTCGPPPSITYSPWPSTSLIPDAS